MKKLDLSIVSTGDNLVALMMKVTESTLQFEPLNLMRNSFDCSSVSGCQCLLDIDKTVKRAMQFLFKTFVYDLAVKLNCALKSSADNFAELRKLG